MRRELFVSVFTLLSFCQTLQAQHSNCQASPYPLQVSQPNGTSLWVVGKGDADLSYTETVDGYTLLLNSAGVYEYAVPGSQGLLVLSGHPAHDAALRSVDEQNYLQQTMQHQRHAPAQAKLLQEASRGPLPAFKANQLSWGFPSTGQKKVLVILIQYPDLKAKFSKDTFDSFMNKPGFAGTGSFHDFYFSNSFGKFDVSADVVGWYTAKKTYTNYGKNKGYGVAAALVAEALDSAEAMGVDFSKYDNDKDGKMDGLLVIHSGNGAEQGSQNQYIWSHRSSLGGSNARTFDGVNISEYCINPETRSTTDMVGIGVYVHEFGHIMGLPDLYATDYNSEGIGNWGVMGGGGWLNNEHTPCNFEAWSKMQLGWQQPVEISEHQQYKLYAAADSNISFLVKTPYTNEFFLLEYRFRKKFDAFLPGRGMAIWHINTDVTSQYPGNNSVNNDISNLGVGLVEADGKFQLNNNINRGDNGDVFPGLYKKTFVNDQTTPSLNLYDGSYSEVEITEIAESDSTVTFYLGHRPGVGVAGVKGESFISVYPNPVSKQANVTMHTSRNLANALVTLTDLSGKMLSTLYNGTLPKGDHNLSTQSFSPGIYLLVVESESGRQVQKLLVRD